MDDISYWWDALPASRTKLLRQPCQRVGYNSAWTPSTASLCADIVLHQTAVTTYKIKVIRGPFITSDGGGICKPRNHAAGLSSIHVMSGLKAGKVRSDPHNLGAKTFFTVHPTDEHALTKSVNSILPTYHLPKIPYRYGNNKFPLMDTGWDVTKTITKTPFSLMAA